MTAAVKENIHEVSDAMTNYKDKFSDAQKLTADYVQKNPWKAVGIAVAAGYVASKVINLIK